MLAVVLTLLDPEQAVGATDGIVAFELAGSGAEAERIVDGWAGDGTTYATWALVLDYLFLVAYGVALLVCCALVAERAGERGWERTRRVGWVAAAFGPTAALLDAIENALLLVELHRGATDLSASVARAAATAKFALVALAVGYVLVVGAATVAGRPRIS